MAFPGFLELVYPGAVCPPCYGDWKNVHRRFTRWRDKGTWEKLLEIFINEADMESLIFDAPHCRCHPHAAGGWKSGHDAHKRGLNSKIHLSVDAHGMPLRAIITRGTAADCTIGKRLTEGSEADFGLGGKGYGTDEIVNFPEDCGIICVIPQKKNRRDQRWYDKDIYIMRHLAENAFLRLKRSWRGLAAGYAKNTSSFLAVVHFACLFQWLNIS
jgi:transposase